MVGAWLKSPAHDLPNEIGPANRRRAESSQGRAAYLATIAALATLNFSLPRAMPVLDLISGQLSEAVPTERCTHVRVEVASDVPAVVESHLDAGK